MCFTVLSSQIIQTGEPTRPQQACVACIMFPQKPVNRRGQLLLHFLQFGVRMRLWHTYLSKSCETHLSYCLDTASMNHQKDQKLSLPGLLAHDSPFMQQQVQSWLLTGKMWKWLIAQNGAWVSVSGDFTGAVPKRVHFNMVCHALLP